ncbi:MAG: ABC transporter substrate-binding protein [Anaerolineales bacterium]|nr:ABC transporter substrate-binding protein [Anaerolineales bacterium]
MRILRFFPVLFILVLLVSACSSPAAEPAEVQSPSELEDVRLILPYRPDVQFAPFYVGMEEGFFKRAGINLLIEHTQESDAVTLVGAGEVPFAVVSGEQVLLARAQGLPVVYVTAWYQDYPVGVAAPVNSSITEPQDLVGKKVGIPVLSGASYVGYRALLNAAGISPETIYLDTIGYNQVELLLQGVEEAVVIYSANEPLQLESMGMPVDVIRVSDYVTLASNGLITSETMIEEQPELVRAMVAAMVSSIESSMADTDRAFAACEKYVDGLDESTSTIQEKVLQESINFWESEIIGMSNPEAWQNMQDVLLEMDLLTEPLNLEDAYTNEFLP